MQLLRRRCVPSAVAPSSSRTKVRARFVLGLDGLQTVLNHLQRSSARVNTHELPEDKYSSMLQEALESTFTCPPGQLSGKSGRRCTLEDGERILDWCIQERPWDLHPRVIQLRNLMKQGRERDVPWLAIKALQETGVRDCDISSECYVQVLQAVLLGLKAIYKLELTGDVIPMDPTHSTFTLLSFLQAAQQAVPGMAQDLLNISKRLHRQVSCCSPETRRQMLCDRDGYMSCVDLQFVAGEHHALSGCDLATGAAAPVRQPVSALANGRGEGAARMPTRKFKELRL